MGNTVHEAIIAEILGDVGKLRDEVKALRTALPAISAEVARKLEGHAQTIVTAAKNLGEEAAFTEAQINRYADESARLAAEWARDEIRKTAIEAATTAVRTGVASEMGKSAAQLTRDLHHASIELRAVVEELRTQDGMGWFMLFVAGGCGLLGGLAVFAAMLISGFVQSQ